MLVVFDLDGTLADCSHREHFLSETPKKWDRFFSEAFKDKPVIACATILRALARSVGFKIVVLTGRPEKYRLMSELWLEKHYLRMFIDKVYMRPHGERMDDHELKKIQITKILEDYQGLPLLCVFEDRNRVVKMWREMGITCLQPREGDF